MKYKFRQALLTLIFLVFLAGIHLFVYTKNIGLKYSLTDIKVKLGEVMSRNRELSCQLAAKENLNYINSVATGKLNMVYPEKINYLLGTNPPPVPASAEASPEG